MTVSDWPNEGLADFWAGHSVLSATLSTLLLVGAGYLALEARENHEQQVLTGSLASVAFGGCVDHLIDIDVALSLVLREAAPVELVDGKPLRWLRPFWESLGDRDPRSSVVEAGSRATPGAWRTRVVDECVRRLMGVCVIGRRY